MSQVPIGVTGGVNLATGAATGVPRASTSGYSHNSDSGRNRELYIYELPYTCHQQLCDHLDGLDVWVQLATLMKLHPIEHQQILRERNAGRSPSEELLHIWGGQYNHTVTELFHVFMTQRLYQAMRLIKDYVERKYHKFIPQSQPDMSALISPSSVKLLNCTHSEIGTCDHNNSSSYSTTSNETSVDKQRDETQASTYLSRRNLKEYACSLLEIDYAELGAATNNWSEQNILGKGGFGIVYRGYWKYTNVAIKQIHYRGKTEHESVKVQIQQSLNELKYLNSCRHDNVVALYGYSIKGDKPCLVYQLMTSGSLEGRLDRASTVPPLTWRERMNICFGTARGINFLHTFRNKPLIHGDIKPANVLLDQCLLPKIGDFGLAREGPNTINTAVQISRPVGTRYYLPPEYLYSKKLSTKVDIYSYGLVVLQTFTGMHIVERSRAHPRLADHVKHLAKQQPLETIIESHVPVLPPSQQEMYISSITLGLACIADRPDERPEMEQVLKELECFIEQ